MTTSISERQGPLSRAHWVILATHALGAVAVGIAGVVNTAGADGFGDLALIVSLMLAALWIAGVVLSWAVARFLVANRWARAAIVTLGPLSGAVLLIVMARG